MVEPGSGALAPCMHPGFTFEAVQPLIQSVDVDGRALTAVFRCPRTRHVVRAGWSAPPVGVSAAHAMERSTAMYGVRSQVNGMIRGLLGYGHAGRAARTLADSTIGAGTQLTATEEERGVVDAFRAVAFRFAWVDGAWVHASEVGQEADGLDGDEAPALSRYDRLVAARMLVAVATSHGGISDDERLHLTEVLDPEVGSLEGLLRRPPLTRAELAEVGGREVRRTLLEVAWSVALCDAHFDAAERAVLLDFARGLGLDTEACIAVELDAQRLVLDQFLERADTMGGLDVTARQQLHALAARIGVSEGAVDRAEARFLKRRA